MSHLPNYTKDPFQTSPAAPELLTRIDIPDDPFIVNGCRDNLGHIPIRVHRNAIDNSSVTYECAQRGQGRAIVYEYI